MKKKEEIKKTKQKKNNKDNKNSINNKSKNNKNSIEEEIIRILPKILPKLLREQSEFRHQILGILVENLASKEELKLVLEEIKKLREDMNKRFEAIDKRFEMVDKKFEETREDMDKRFKEMREDMDKRFEGVMNVMDKRFEGVMNVIRRLYADVAYLKGSDAERKYRDKAHSIFGLVLFKGKNYESEVARILWKAEKDGIITRDERREVLLSDMLWYGERDRRWCVLVVEASWTIEDVDVTRARKRSEILRKVGIPAIPVVAGVQISPDVDVSGVVWFTDGKFDEEGFEELFSKFSKEKEKSETEDEKTEDEK